MRATVIDPNENFICFGIFDQQTLEVKDWKDDPIHGKTYQVTKKLVTVYESKKEVKHTNPKDLDENKAYVYTRNTVKGEEWVDVNNFWLPAEDLIFE